MTDEPYPYLICGTCLLDGSSEVYDRADDEEAAVESASELLKHFWEVGERKMEIEVIRDGDCLYHGRTDTEYPPTIQ